MNIPPIFLNAKSIYTIFDFWSNTYLKIYKRIAIINCIYYYLTMFIKNINWLIKNIFLIPVHLYRLIISPWTRSACIYTPSCSKYMIEAVHGHGIIRGGILGLTRVGRCHGTFFIGGEDPIPDEFKWKSVFGNYKKFHLKKTK